jgi:transposase
MKKSSQFFPEVSERAVRLVQEHRGAYPSLWAATTLLVEPASGRLHQLESAWVSLTLTSALAKVAI